MNDLSMGPLPAKIKQERDVAGEKTVFRCGVRSCPEILAVQRDQIWQNRVAILAKYQNRKGVYSTSKRSGGRDFETRKTRRGERAHIVKENREAYLDTRNTPEQLAAMDGLDAYRLAEIDRPEVRYPTLLDISDEALIKCARCGRLSKINGAGL